MRVMVFFGTLWFLRILCRSLRIVCSERALMQMMRCCAAIAGLNMLLMCSKSNSFSKSAIVFKPCSQEQHSRSKLGIGKLPYMHCCHLSTQQVLCWWTTECCIAVAAQCINHCWNFACRLAEGADILHSHIQLRLEWRLHPVQAFPIRTWAGLCAQPGPLCTHGLLQGISAQLKHTCRFRLRQFQCSH